MVGDLIDPRRSEPGFLLGERDMLEGWLEFHRMTLLLKCEGLDDAQRKARAIGTSLLSLHGLVRHMAEVERGWFQRVLQRSRETGTIWATDEHPDADLAPIEDASFEEDLAIWQQQCALSREVAAPLSLEHEGLSRGGEPCSLRWIYVHMIEEYARHNGHADFLRELVDGAVGY